MIILIAPFMLLGNSCHLVPSLPPDDFAIEYVGATDKIERRCEVFDVEGHNLQTKNIPLGFKTAYLDKSQALVQIPIDLFTPKYMHVDAGVSNRDLPSISDGLHIFGPAFLTVFGDHAMVGGDQCDYWNATIPSNPLGTLADDGGRRVVCTYVTGEALSLSIGTQDGKSVKLSLKWPDGKPVQPNWRFVSLAADSRNVFLFAAPETGNTPDEKIPMLKNDHFLSPSSPASRKETHIMDLCEVSIATGVCRPLAGIYFKSDLDALPEGGNIVCKESKRFIFTMSDNGLFRIPY